jgi:type II secretory pathway component PulF
VPTFRRLLDGLLLRIPIWGNLHRCRSIARFLHLLDELYTAGINPSRAWSAASITPRNSEISEKLRRANNITSASMGIADMIAISGVLEPEEIALIASGEKSGRVPEVLSRLSNAYTEKAKLQKHAGRVLSISLMFTFVIALTGAAIIVIVKTYIDPITKFLWM